ncbi:MAG TPA: chemotaxis protein CheW [Candidatus Acidoferrum sp.]|nr:chemotaxis protein CheW [Candidatus Acidoferrum sp.]
MKIAAPEPGKSRRARQSEQMILFTVANRTFAIAAETVQEIRSTDSLAGSAREIDDPQVLKVRHTFERSHQTYYVVNAGAHFGLPITRPTLVLILRKLRVAVLVDRIERMAEIGAIYPLPRAFEGQERRWYRGLTHVDDHVIPVIEPSGFLSSEEFHRLDHFTGPSAAQGDLEGIQA